MKLTMMLRHLIAILLLPFVVVLIVPRWLLSAWSMSDTRWIDGTVTASLGHLAGIVVFLAGFGLFAWCVSLFARAGQGTLAPWDPTRRLVAVGPLEGDLGAQQSDDLFGHGHGSATLGGPGEDEKRGGAGTSAAGTGAAPE